jgi:AcrR family transcriptional regulator
MSRPADPRVKIELLRAAEATFAQHGLAAAKVEDITARAGVSKGAFYLHFVGKEDCFKQIAEGFLARLANCIEPPPSSLDEGPSTAAEQIERWHAHDTQIFEFCWENRALLRMILEGSAGSPYNYLVDEFAERAGRNIAAWVRHGIGTGLYRADLDPEIVALLIGGAYDRLARELLRLPAKPDLDGWCRQALALFYGGLAAGGPRAIFDLSVNHKSSAAKAPTRAAKQAPTGLRKRATP